jgi:O-antigen ligase
MTAGRAAADSSPPHPLAITVMAVVAGLSPLVVFGNQTAMGVLAAAALAATLAMAMLRPRTCWLLAIACLPITMAWPIAATGAEIGVPLEVLAGVFAPLLLLALVRDPRPVRRLLLNPVSIAVCFQLAWMTGATVFSVDHLVSVKALAVRVVYLTVFYLGGLIVLDRARSGPDPDPVKTTTAAAVCLAVPITVWTLARHAVVGFARRESYEIAQPFFSNHTEYATVLVVWFCLAVGLRENLPARHRRLLTLLLALLLAAVLAAGARSAWIGLLAALVTLAALQFKPDPWRTAAIAALIALAAGASFLTLSGHRLEPDSFSDGATVHARALDTLLTYDLVGGESSKERLNRWQSARRMLRDRPFFGFGPATFEASYGTYQQYQQLTRVSTFSGDRGGAHSELMTVAAEHGLGGILSLIAVLALGLLSGVRAVRQAATSRDHWWATAWTAALVALIVSSCFNSLFELDKTAPLFWLSAAVLVHLDLRSGAAPEHAAKDLQGPFGGTRPAEDA